MKKIKTYVLNEQDEEIVRLFTDLGMPRYLAKTLLYVSQVDECRSSDVEKGANLRQPEVSVAMRKLRQRGWVEKRVLKKKGKGRPINIYNSTKNLSEIWKIIKQEKLKEIENIKRDMAQLKNIIERRNIGA
jgi:predicted transcriptional regulator